MDIQHLVYCGKREEGILRVGRVDVLSEWRNVKYYKGLKFQVGKAIPLEIADIIAKDYPSVFKIETKEIDDKEGYTLQIGDIIEECLAVLGDDQTLEVISNLVDVHFADYDVKKKSESKPKPKKTRRRNK
jgi:hypothetical protein